MIVNYIGFKDSLQNLNKRFSSTLFKLQFIILLPCSGLLKSRNFILILILLYSSRPGVPYQSFSLVLVLSWGQIMITSPVLVLSWGHIMSASPVLVLSWGQAIIVSLVLVWSWGQL